MSLRTAAEAATRGPASRTARSRAPSPVGAYAARAARAAARVRARAAARRARQPARGAHARLLRAARRRRRDPVRGVAQRLGEDARRGPAQAPAEGMQVVVAGGCDYYPGSATSSPGFSFNVHGPAHRRRGRSARADRAPAQAARRARGCSSARSSSPRTALPARRSASSPARRGKARDDVLAALGRRGWAGRLVWAFAPVQDRHAAPAIARALGDLAAVAEVEVVIVARGGGSLADLLCFCDETLCRTVALLPVPVIASVGHHTDRTLLDDVAAVSCSTPTHAAEAAVAIDCARARREQLAAAARLRRARAPRARGASGQAARGQPPARARPPRGARARSPPGAALARARRPSRAPAHAAAPAAARDPRRLAAPRRRASARWPPRARSCSRARRPRRCANAASAARASSNGSRWRSAATTRSARSSAATCSRAPRRRRRWRAARARPRGRRAALRFADGEPSARGGRA